MLEDHGAMGREIGSPSGSTKTASRIPSPSRTVGSITKRTPCPFNIRTVPSRFETFNPIATVPARINVIRVPDE